MLKLYYIWGLFANIFVNLIVFLPCFWAIKQKKEQFLSIALFYLT